MDRRPPTRSFSDISLGQILRGLSRYKPVGVVVLGILVVAVLAPAPGGSDGGPAVAQGGGTQGGFQPQDPSGAGPSEATPPPTPSRTPSTPAPPTGGSQPAETPEPTPAPTESPSGFDPGPDGDDDPGGDEGSDEPLRVAGSGWASQGAGTPLASTDVPDGTLPVGKRADQLDKASFVRLEGSGFQLELTEDPEGARGVQDPAVQACEITEPGWPEEEAMSFEEAPEWNPDACAPGTRNDDGTWTFALATFAPASEGPGFALVPGPEAPIDFQVTFEAS